MKAEGLASLGARIPDIRVIPRSVSCPVLTGCFERRHPKSFRAPLSMLRRVLFFRGLGQFQK